MIRRAAPAPAHRVLRPDAPPYPPAAGCGRRPTRPPAPSAVTPPRRESAATGRLHVPGFRARHGCESQGGNITLGKRVSRAMVLARDGGVTIHYCEHSTIIGRVVHIEHAVSCEIIAEEVSADVVEGCMIAAEKIKIASADESRGKETLVTALIPDLSVSDQGIAALKKKITEAQENSMARMG